MSQTALWPDLEAKEVDLSQVDRVASALEFAQVWRAECESRWPDTAFTAEVRPGQPQPATVDTSTNHPYGKELAKEMTRLGMNLYTAYDKWLVKRGTERHRYWLMKFGVPLDQLEPQYADDVPGEAGDSPEDGGGITSADGAVSSAAGDAGAQV